jgi:hypothetical protein
MTPRHSLRRFSLPGLLLLFLAMAVVPRAVGAPDAAGHTSAAPLACPIIQAPPAGR